MAQYPVEVYAQLSVSDLHRRFNNLEVYLRPLRAHRDTIKRCIEDIEFAQQTLKDINAQMKDVAEDMQNIVTAIAFKEQR